MERSDVVKLLKNLENLEVYMIYMVLAVGSFLVVFGSSRRRFNSAFLRFLIMVAFNSSFTIITLIIGQMVLKPPVTTQILFYPCWVYFLLMFHGISDGISAQALEDNEQWNRLVLSTLCAGLIWVIGTFVRYGNRYSLPASTINIIIAMVFASTYKDIDRIKCLKKGSKNGVALDTKRVADFMGNDQHEFPAYPHNYVVFVQETEKKWWFWRFWRFWNKDPRPRIDIASEKVITVEKVWNCEGQLLSATVHPDSKRKDLCLSFSMYNLLCCHFGGYNSFPQSTRDRQLEFVRGVLLHGDVGAGENYRRPFWLIEQELGFLYDRFYTKYAYLFQKYQVMKVSWYVIAAAATIVWQLDFLNSPFNDPKLKLKESPHNDILVTRIIVGVFMCLEFLQFIFLVMSNWGKLFCLCKYVGKPSWRSSRLCALFVKVVCSFPSSQLWGRQLGQYCFLESFNKTPGWIDREFFKDYYENPGKGHVESSFVPLPPQVQRAVLAWIKRNGRQLTKGRSSLIGNGVRNPELLSACEFEEATKVIMIWHIATSLCEFQHGKTSRAPLETFGVSVALSKYCAYLVAFAPRLLPDHYMCTHDLFGSAVTGAERMLEGCKSMEDKYSKLMNLSEIVQSLQTDFVAGAGGRVAKLLMEEAGDDVERLWKILADFWTEMVLFVAPADDPWPHAEHLAQGGEFVTHLMALLFHAGVSKREFIEDDAMV